LSAAPSVHASGARKAEPPNAPAYSTSAGDAQAHDRFLRFKEVARRVGLSRTTIWRLEQEQRFPARRKISSRTVAWLESEIEQWIGGRARVVDRNGR
jgi:prophage regulatory protein